MSLTHAHAHTPLLHYWRAMILQGKRKAETETEPPVTEEADHGQADPAAAAIFPKLSARGVR